jgi:hypothetical protein
VSDLLPNSFAHFLFGLAMIPAGCLAVWFLAKRAKTSGGRKRWTAAIALPLIVAVALWGAIYNLTWEPGLPDIIYTGTGMYEWGSGFADDEPANPCASAATIKARGVGPLTHIGYVVDESYGLSAWTAHVGPHGTVPVYRSDRWTLVVVPRPGCFVVYPEQV